VIENQDSIAYVQSFYRQTLKWCDCGDPEGVMRLMRDVLDAIRWNFDENEGRKLPYEHWQAKIRPLLGEIGSPLCMSYFYVLGAAGLVEHGGGLVNGGWLSDEGDELLEHLKKVADTEWSDIVL
jgi:hypothetical protein